jgi:hypothetical protein
LQRRLSHHALPAGISFSVAMPLACGFARPGATNAD